MKGESGATSKLSRFDGRWPRGWLKPFGKKTAQGRRKAIELLVKRRVHFEMQESQAVRQGIQWLIEGPAENQTSQLPWKVIEPPIEGQLVKVQLEQAISGR